MVVEPDNSDGYRVGNSFLDACDALDAET